MPDHLAVDASEHVIVEPKFKPAHVRAARHISNILAPVSISLPLVVLVALYHARNVALALLYALTTLFFLSVGPLIYILIAIRMGKISDIDVSRRAERAGPFLFCISSALAGWLVLIISQGPKDLQTVLIITGLSGIVMMVTTLWWKISIHASSMGGAATMLTALYGAVMLPAFLLLILVSWSRVVLRRHTVLQVVAGSLVSIALTLLVLKIRGI